MIGIPIIHIEHFQRLSLFDVDKRLSTVACAQLSGA
jgi:hypothetical protein